MLSISWPNPDLLFAIKQHCYHGHTCDINPAYYMLDRLPSLALGKLYCQGALKVFSKISLITYITACSVAFEVDDDNDDNDDNDDDDGNDNDNDNDVEHIRSSNTFENDAIN
uniref:Uncharacterized protein n=1 Tax=Glossina pallidipes TaxID=7398 RepID=A0A1A9Z4D2_GLOPL